MNRVLSYAMVLLLAACGAKPSAPNDGGPGDQDAGPPPRVLPLHGLDATSLGVLINTDDSQSVEVGSYYVQRHAVPEANVVRLALGTFAHQNNVDRATFAHWKQQIDAALPSSVQALAVTWTFPSTVDCMSLTTALAYGFDTKWCASMAPCSETARSDYFDSATQRPFTELQVRPAMMLAGKDATEVKALIDRGVSAQGTFPKGDGYFLRTHDPARSVRWYDFIQTVNELGAPDALTLHYSDAYDGGVEALSHTTNVLFYFTGLANVPDVDTNTYVPGAIADHLTSYGGIVSLECPGAGQLSILCFLRAGATGSYGTVTEPCNFTDKFPQTSIAVRRYFMGESLVESYWKSVATPGEGLFVGDPLARPWGTAGTFSEGTLTIRTTELTPGKLYDLVVGPTESGPWAPVLVGVGVLTPQLKTVTVNPVTGPVYRFAPH